MKKGILLLMLFAILAISQHTYAIIAHPQPQRYTLPNGEHITIKIRGDEHFNWITTTDGYRIMLNNEGYFVYSSALKSNTPALSKIVAHNEDKRSQIEQKFLSTLPKQLGIGEQIELRKKTVKNSTLKAAAGAFPTTGTRKNILILANFNDRTTTYSQLDFNKIMNEDNHNGIGCFKDYYKENSHNTLTINTDVTVWVTVPNSHNYYSDQSKWAEFAYDAISAANSQVDFSQYESNGTTLYGVTIIHQGLGQETSGNQTDIWSHQGQLSSFKPFSADRKFDGVVINSYSMQPEIFDQSGIIASLGVMVHEFGHLFGLPDFYDTDYSESGGLFAGTGNWDLMAGGAYNGSYDTQNPNLQEGASPAHMNPLVKINLGWATVQNLSAPTTISLNPIQTTNQVLKIPTATTKEFFYIENRSKVGFDALLPGNGMLIYHVDSTWIAQHDAANDINAASHQGLYLKSAANSYTNLPNCPFPGSGEVTSITDNTTPNLKSWLGANTNKSITNIHFTGGNVITFDFMALQDGAPLSFDALPYTQSENRLQWTKSTSLDPVMVAFSTTPTFGDPIDGTSYNNLDPIVGGGTVIYNGANSSFNHTSLTAKTTYYYKIWSNASGVYSSPLSAVASTDTTYTMPWNEAVIDVIPFWKQQWLAGSNTEWSYKNGSYYGIPSAVDINDPDTTILAIAQTEEGYNNSRLITPAFITPATNHRLSFKHAQPAYYQDQDTLKVLFKSRTSNTWTTLATFNADIPNWRFADIDLPITAEPFQLAFETSVFNGNGVYIDSLSIVSTPLLAPLSHKIKVTSNTLPIANASVTLFGQTIITNGLGEANITVNPSRNWEVIKISMNGYETKTIKRYANSAIIETVDLTTSEAITPTNFIATKDYKSVTLNWNPVIDEGFELYQPWDTLNLGGWKQIDGDDEISGGFNAFDYPKSLSRSAFVVFDGLYGGVNSNFEPHSGTQMAVSFFSYSPPNNDWLISPQVTIASGDYLELFARSANSLFAEEMRVLISEETFDPADFTTLHATPVIEVPSLWTKYSYDLSAYAGKKIYFAINCVSNDKYALLIDDIKLKNINSDYTPLSAQLHAHTATPEISGNIEYQLLRSGSIIKTFNGFESNEYTDVLGLCNEYTYALQTNYIAQNQRSSNTSLTISTCREVMVEVKDGLLPIEGALVKIGTLEVTTGADGKANFTGVSDGDQLLTISKIGYQIHNETVTITTDITFSRSLTISTSISKTQFANLVVGPIPSSGIITVTNIDIPVPFNWALYAIDGTVVEEGEIVKKGGSVLDLTTASEGIYIIKFWADSKIETRKLLLKR